jgi:hypothetical protein
MKIKADGVLARHSWLREVGTLASSFFADLIFPLEEKSGLNVMFLDIESPNM